MNLKKLKKILAKIRSLQAGSGDVERQELVSIAKKLGRTRAKRGKEGIYVSTLLPERSILRIPSHRRIKRGTASNILSDLEADVFYLKDKGRGEEGKSP